MYILELCITSCLLSKWMKNPYGSFCAVSGESVSHLARRSASGPLRTPSRVASKGLVRSLSSRVSPERARVCFLSVARRSWDARSVCWRWCDSLASEPCNFIVAWDAGKCSHLISRECFPYAPPSINELLARRKNLPDAARNCNGGCISLIYLLPLWGRFSSSRSSRIDAVTFEIARKSNLFYAKLRVFRECLKTRRESLEIVADGEELFMLQRDL